MSEQTLDACLRLADRVHEGAASIRNGALKALLTQPAGLHDALNRVWCLRILLGETDMAVKRNCLELLVHMSQDEIVLQTLRSVYQDPTQRVPLRRTVLERLYQYFPPERFVTSALELLGDQTEADLLDPISQSTLRVILLNASELSIPQLPGSMQKKLRNCCCAVMAGDNLALHCLVLQHAIHLGFSDKAYSRLLESSLSSTDADVKQKAIEMKTQWLMANAEPCLDEFPTDDILSINQVRAARG